MKEKKKKKKKTNPIFETRTSNTGPQAIYRVKTFELVNRAARRHVEYLLMSQYTHAVSLLTMAELIEET